MKLTRTKARKQYVAKSQKYPIKTTFKEAGPEKIQIFSNHKINWLRSILAKVTRRIGNTQCFQGRLADTIQETPI